MFNGMSNEESSFLERISATAIVNQAVLKCNIAGMSVTHENVIFFIGDFADPAEPLHSSLIEQIERSINDVMVSVVLSKIVRQAIH